MHVVQPESGVQLSPDFQVGDRFPYPSRLRRTPIVIFSDGIQSFDAAAHRCGKTAGIGMVRRNYVTVTLCIYPFKRPFFQVNSG